MKLNGPKWKPWGAWLCVSLGLGFLLLNAVAYRQAYAMMHFGGSDQRTGLPETLSPGQKLKVLLWGVTIPRPHSQLASGALGSAARSLKIPGEGGIELGAWSCAAPSAKGLVILFHGYTAEKSGLVPEGKIFSQLGYSVLLVDFRGSGDSSESYTTIGYSEADDVLAAVRYARETFSPAKIILYGQFMGAAAILRAVDQRGVKPDAIIVEAVFDKLLNTVRHRFEAMRIPSFPGAELLVLWGGAQAGFDGFKHNPSDYSHSVKCPILFFHGTEDPRARVAEGRAVYEAVPGPKEFKEFPKVGHASVLSHYPSEWKQTIRDFLKSNAL